MVSIREAHRAISVRLADMTAADPPSPHRGRGSRRHHLRARPIRPAATRPIGDLADVIRVGDRGQRLGRLDPRPARGRGPARVRRRRRRGRRRDGGRRDRERRPRGRARDRPRTTAAPWRTRSPRWARPAGSRCRSPRSGAVVVVAGPSRLSRRPCRAPRGAGGGPADRARARHRPHARQPGARDGPDPGHRRAHARAHGPRHPRRAHPAALGRPARGPAPRGRPGRRRGGRPAHPGVDAPGARAHLRDRGRRAARDARADRPPAPGAVRGPPPGATSSRTP